MRSNAVDKIPNTNTMIKSSRAVSSEVYNFKKGEVVYTAQKFIDQLKQQMVTWAIKQKKSRSIQHFLNKHGWFRSDFDYWLSTHEDLKATYKDVLCILGAIREDQATYNRLANPNMIMQTQAYYSPELKECKQLEAELKAKSQAAITNQSGGGKIVIEMVDYVGEKTKPIIVEVKENE